MSMDCKGKVQSTGAKGLNCGKCDYLAFIAFSSINCKVLLGLVGLSVHVWNGERENKIGW